MTKKKIYKRCDTCHGLGTIINRLSKRVSCPTCKGEGWLKQTMKSPRGQSKPMPA